VKNIIICIDGSGQEFGKFTNVELLARTAPLSDGQYIYYDAGIGTFGEVGKLKALLNQVGGGAFGFGILKEVTEAYSYLMDHYNDGDRIYMFGYSRGAYTVRILCGLIQAFGLLHAGNQNQLSYIIKMYNQLLVDGEKGKKAHRIRDQFRKVFCRDVRVHFVGLWDTVSSVGFIAGIFGKAKVFYGTRTNKIIDNIYHAVAIDEKRRFFRHNLFEEAFDGQNLNEQWFVGTHGDIGGGNGKGKSKLSQIAFQWVAQAAKDHGLTIDSGEYSKVTGQTDDAFDRADHTAQINPSVGLMLWMEFLPRCTGEFFKGQFVQKQRWPWKCYSKLLTFWKLRSFEDLAEPREIHSKAVFHQSVCDRESDLEGYKMPDRISELT
jgi:uncharacterized protein (DUF2235 family)